ncbi:MAG: hypothetical protein HKM93_13995 [Desulfobacteraceae bacterium]|nr:hypothetical protein [Desulfobacteraceae bacterium]
MNGKPYTCKAYREEMILVGLRKRLNDDGLTEAEKASIKSEIKALEKKMGLD